MQGCKVNFKPRYCKVSMSRKVLMITRKSRYCKLDCLKALVTRAKLAEEFGVGSSTIIVIMKNKDRI